MDHEQKRQALRLQIDKLSGTQLDTVSDFVGNLMASESAAAARAAVIRSLPRVITDYPILVWGWDPCTTNDIAEVWFGPLSAPVVNVRKNYPQHANLDRDQSLAMIVSDPWDEKVRFGSDSVEAWGAAAGVTGEELHALEQWAAGAGNWPVVYDPKDKSVRPAGFARVAADADYFIEGLAEQVCIKAGEVLSGIVRHIQGQLRSRGTALSSTHPEVGFSFNRDGGTIDYLDGGKFIPLVQRAAVSPPAGILVGQGLSVEGKDLSGASLAQKLLDDMNMRGVNLAGASLQQANLEWSDLTDANLVGANLTGASLRSATLTRADLTGADLTDAELGNAALEGVVFDETTRWPDGFSPPRSA